MNEITPVHILSLFRDARWDAVIDASEECMRQWENQSSIGETEFETARRTFEKEYKKQGVREFLKFLEEIT